MMPKAKFLQPPDVQRITREMRVLRGMIKDAQDDFGSLCGGSNPPRAALSHCNIGTYDVRNSVRNSLCFAGNNCPSCFHVALDSMGELASPPGDVAQVPLSEQFSTNKGPGKNLSHFVLSGQVN
jgi:hypothetical protein